jgi:hypothetical protein
VTAVLTACGSDNSLTAALKASLDRHQALWAQRTFTNYSFDLDQTKLGLTSKVHVVVEGTTIVSVVDRTTGEPPEVDAGYVTIDDLFTLAQASFGQKNTTLQMEFNEQLGFPTLVQINNINPGGGYAASVANLAPTE